MRSNFFQCALMCLSMFLIAGCGAHGIRQVAENGLYIDSCRLMVTQHRLSNGMLELGLKIIDERGDLGDTKGVLFDMEHRFELLADSVTLMPVFFQPIASGASNTLMYLIAFEGKESQLQGDLILKILPNALVRQTVMYKL